MIAPDEARALAPSAPLRRCQIGLCDVVGTLGILEGALRDRPAFDQQSGAGALSLGKRQVGFGLVEFGCSEIMSRPRRLDCRLQLRLYPHEPNFIGTTATKE
ncbi:hypothetical protein CDO30_18425 (plasmid) [Sinorhizobium meliloti]|nr:hypothetical protein C770_GR4pC0879 [Sinorhizobium meliloti GR4]ASP60326.1 hypothetical protein CDO30_18425 [Sinorhizobium meliloti]